MAQPKTADATTTETASMLTYGPRPPLSPSPVKLATERASAARPIAAAPTARMF
jgi:hypothetical protein